jgi:hypothetical protein
MLRETPVAPRRSPSMWAMFAVQRLDAANGEARRIVPLISVSGGARSLMIRRRLFFVEGACDHVNRAARVVNVVAKAHWFAERNIR